MCVCACAFFYLFDRSHLLGISADVVHDNVGVIPERVRDKKYLRVCICVRVCLFCVCAVACLCMCAFVRPERVRDKKTLWVIRLENEHDAGVYVGMSVHTHTHTHTHLASRCSVALEHGDDAGL